MFGCFKKPESTTQKSALTTAYSQTTSKQSGGSTTAASLKTTQPASGTTPSSSETTVKGKTTQPSGQPTPSGAETTTQKIPSTTHVPPTQPTSGTTPGSVAKSSSTAAGSGAGTKPTVQTTVSQTTLPFLCGADMKANLLSSLSDASSFSIVDNTNQDVTSSLLPGTNGWKPTQELNSITLKFDSNKHVCLFQNYIYSIVLHVLSIKMKIFLF